MALESVRKVITDWRTPVLLGILVVGLTVAAVSLGVDRPLRIAVQLGFGMISIMFGLLEWRNELRRARRETA